MTAPEALKAMNADADRNQGGKMPNLPVLAALKAGTGAAGGRPRIDCGHFDIRIDRNGQWYYRGSPIGRKELVCLFATVLKREPDGSYWLETPVERGRIDERGTHESLLATGGLSASLCREAESHHGLLEDSTPILRG